MSTRAMDHVRAARATDGPQLLRLWALVYEEDGADPRTEWTEHARQWFERVVDDRLTVCLPVIEVAGDVVATAVGTLELGIPNPHSPLGRTVRLANLVTLPAHRGRGYGTLLVRHVIEWARSVDADRVDLSATPDGQRIYDRAGFELTRAPRMKLMLRSRVHPKRAGR